VYASRGRHSGDPPVLLTAGDRVAQIADHAVSVQCLVGQPAAVVVAVPFPPLVDVTQVVFMPLGEVVRDAAFGPLRNVVRLLKFKQLRNAGYFSGLMSTAPTLAFANALDGPQDLIVGERRGAMLAIPRQQQVGGHFDVNAMAQ